MIRSGSAAVAARQPVRGTWARTYRDQGKGIAVLWEPANGGLYSTGVLGAMDTRSSILRAAAAGGVLALALLAGRRNRRNRVPDETSSGEPYADYARNHIFSLLGMAHSYASPAEAKQNGMAVGHRYWFAAPFAAPDLPVPRGSLPGGELISCSGDMARYLVSHLNGGRYGGGGRCRGPLVRPLRHGMVYRGDGTDENNGGTQAPAPTSSPTWRSYRSRKRVWSCS